MAVLATSLELVELHLGDCGAVWQCLGRVREPGLCGKVTLLAGAVVLFAVLDNVGLRVKRDVIALLRRLALKLEARRDVLWRLALVERCRFGDKRVAVRRCALELAGRDVLWLGALDLFGDRPSLVCFLGNSRALKGARLDWVVWRADCLLVGNASD